jgi:AraC family transcriptional regulator, regulatory protein of adaptative response / DNA-3-methyladenine glycosylase II
MALPTMAPAVLPHGSGPPIDWPAALRYLGPRAIAGVEYVAEDARYVRAVRVLGHAGYIVVRERGRGRHLAVEISSGLLPVVDQVMTRVQRLFDLDRDPRPIAAHLARDPLLAPLVARRPTLRLIGAMDGFELAVRAVLGQAVTVRGASLLAARLTRLVAEPLDDGPVPLTHLPMSPERLAQVSPESLRNIGLTRSRTHCLLALARAVIDHELPELVASESAQDPTGFVRRFTALPGIGPWTAHYVALRALGWSDAFPDGDLGLRKAAGGLSPTELRAAAERWRPWRAYAACHLWSGLASD